jgi:ribosomal-protein-alanine N-acetyltransferase
LCAKQGGTLIGYLIGWDIEPEFHLGNLAVEQLYRRQGVAAHLLEHLMQNLRSRNYEFITLEVREYNTAALKLYQKFGFTPVAIRKQYYTDTKENAIVMVHYFERAQSAAKHKRQTANDVS